MSSLIQNPEVGNQRLEITWTDAALTEAQTSGLTPVETSLVVAYAKNIASQMRYSKVIVGSLMVREITSKRKEVAA